MNDELHYLIVFNSQTHAFFLDSALKRRGHDTEMLNAPKYLTKSCNIAIKLDNREVLKTIREMIQSYNLNVYRIYKVYYEDSKKTYQVIKKS